LLCGRRNKKHLFCKNINLTIKNPQFTIKSCNPHQSLSVELASAYF
jgi:hypothetical protein